MNSGAFLRHLKPALSVLFDFYFFLPCARRAIVVVAAIVVIVLVRLGDTWLVGGSAGLLAVVAVAFCGHLIAGVFTHLFDVGGTFGSVGVGGEQFGQFALLFALSTEANQHI